MRHIRQMIIASIFILLTAAQALSQQRMAFAEGAIELTENEATSVPTYCLDLTRDSPPPGASYNNVLSTPDTARVVVNGKNIPLQDAIAAGKIEIKGEPISFETFLSLINDPDFQQHAHMSAEDKHQAALLGAVWEVSTSEQRKQLQKEFEPLLEQLGDHTRLRFVSHYPEAVKIVFDKTTVVGAKKESIADLDVDHVKAATTNDKQQNVQTVVWVSNTLRQQEALAYLRYYTGAVDGFAGPKTGAAIESFQAANGLPVTGRLEARDTAVLYSRFNQKRLADLNTPSNGPRFVTLSFTPQDKNGVYSLLLPSNSNSIVTSDPETLLKAINTLLPQNNSKTVFVDLTGFPQDRAAALILSLRNGQRSINDDVVLIGLERGDGSVAIQDLMFQKGVEQIRDSDVVIEEIGSGEDAGWFEATIRFVVRVGQQLKSVTLRVTAKTSDIAHQFVAALMALSSGSVSTDQTIASLFADAYRQAHKLNPQIGSDTFKARIRDEAASVQIAEVTIHFASAA